ncbi:MAG: hypothetical protein Q4Q17_00065 [Tissierellia bacterium]|nr:hypothetical protein [Tissierellia bacterium]
MTYFVALIYAYICIRLLAKAMGKYRIWTYVISLLIAVGIQFIHPDIFEILGPLPYGFFVYPLLSASFATALFFFVMWCPLLPKQWTITKLSYGYRTELSIVASVLTLAHNLYYGCIRHQIFISVISNPIDWSEPPYATLISAFLVILLIALWITSYPSVRKKMKPSSWKKLQRLAYPFWIGIHLHVLVLYRHVFTSLAEQGMNLYVFNSLLNFILFATTMVLWIGLKWRKGYQKRTHHNRIDFFHNSY